MGLASAFLAELPPALGAQLAVDSARLEDTLRDHHERGRAAWPGVEVPPEEFAAHLARCVAAAAGASGDPASELARLRTSDLYLALACLHGAPGAAESFERALLGEVTAAVAALRAGDDLHAEAVQRTRTRLLVGAGARPPAIGEYTGRGDLFSWTRVVAVREALALLRGRGREAGPGDEALLQMPASGDDPGLAYLKQVYRAEFREAFHAALAALGPEDRNLLRHHYLHGLTIDQLGALYQVHRATAARRLQKTREQLLLDTRRRLTGRLAVAGDELDSIMRLIASNLEVSIERFLGAPSRDGS